jgi:hypothetical protein
MHIVATVLFALAAIVGLAPTLAFLIFWDRLRSSWLDDLSNHQTLFGALIFAASLASIGALRNRNQRMISARQLAAERREQDLALGLKKQQIASAFIAEIDVILNEVHHGSLRPAIENALRAMELSTGKIEVEGLRIGKHLGRFFDHSPADVRLFPSTISKGLTRFYAIVEETKLDLDWYSRAIETYTNQKVKLMNLTQMIRLLKKIVGKIDSSSKLGRTLIEGLKKIRDTDLD